MVISDYAYGRKDNSFPSRQRIADETRLSLSTVKRAIKRLANLHFIHIRHFTGKDSRTHNSYTIIAKLSAGQVDSDPVQERAPTGATSDPRTGSPVGREEGEGKKEKGIPEGFESLWEQHPARNGRKARKADALRFYRKLVPSRFTASELLYLNVGWTAELGDTLPCDLAVWLNSERWQDTTELKGSYKKHMEAGEEWDGR